MSERAAKGSERHVRYAAREGLLTGVLAGALAINWSRWLWLALLVVTLAAWAWDFWRTDV